MSRFSLSVCKDIGVRKFDFVAKTQFLQRNYNYKKRNDVFHVPLPISNQTKKFHFISAEI